MPDTNDPDTNDVEKHWDDPPAYRAAVKYTLTVVVLALAALALYAWVGERWLPAAATVPTIALVGALGAFLRTYRVWKARGTWVVWQGAGWFLLAFSLVCLAVPGTAA
ncbi:hypothetical protein [uncultured Mycolicibacterium sp.]|uniref:hypothetical protein n=1 Tax=uncultured Mycolicibacterium sp. TaxID=2320817 RepID=UPI0026148CBB|nr:hypothetical protein [uncultured Mycolicibacterium sp.]